MDERFLTSSECQYKVFCADCKNEYVQGGYKPSFCGFCGSDFIAVKELVVWPKPEKILVNSNQQYYGKDWSKFEPVESALSNPPMDENDRCPCSYCRGEDD